ncbi:MAG: hypothetical protein E7596_03380 [Ruminococcaceae bacterium]|nr:hypothetical protein [Oscillospiraceae bacterium]
MVADGVAIEHGNKVYIVDSGKENGKIDFGVRKQVSISDNNLRREYVRRKNNDSISKGYISDELLGRFRYGDDGDRSGDFGREFRKELSADTGEPPNNQESIFDENGDRRRELNLDGKTGDGGVSFQNLKYY